MVLTKHFIMRILLTSCLLFLSFCACTQKYRDGDLIFQHSASSQSTAVQLATNSYFSHCGIIFYMEGKPYVFEAIEPVGVRKLEDWIASGEDQKFTVYRLKDHNLSSAELTTMKSYLKTQLNKHYDLGFNWSDKELYCSELVFKAYKAIGIELCQPKFLRDFNLENPQVRKIMQQRYGSQIPYDEPMVSPGQLSESKLLYQIQ
ncbi:MAG: hypothetical protein RL511_1794 [Bacteroidota bacterium]|jgi:hypothetical protein